MSSARTKGFYINGEHIDVSAKSRGEFTSSAESRYLRSVEPEVFNDKMETAPYLDVISQNAQYQNEVPTHERTDDIVNFERGKIDIKINNKDYIADVLIGIRKDGTKMFYDIPSMNKKTAPIIGSQSAQTANTEAQEPFNDIPSNDSISDFTEKGNSQNKVNYRSLQSISDDLYSRPEGNTVGAKQSIEGTYANAQNKYGVFPEGENAARVVDVPQKMKDETNVRRPDCTTLGFDRGMGVDEVKICLRHEDIETTYNIYTHWNNKKVKQISDKIAGIINIS